MKKTPTAYCVNPLAVWALLMTANYRKGATGMRWLKRFFQAHWKWIITLLGSFFRPVVERVVLPVFPASFEVELLNSAILRFLLFAAAACGITGVFVFVVAPALVRVADWLLRPAPVGSKPRSFYSLLPDVKSCLDVLEKDYEFEAVTRGRSDGVTVPPFDSHVRYAELRSRLGRLFSKLDRLGVPVPDSIQIDSLGDLIDMVMYLTQLKDCVSACDLGAARKIVPP